MVGMGIGSFVDGFARGYGIRQDMIDREQAREGRQRDQEWQDQQRTWMTEDRQFQVEERDRDKRERDAIDAIGAETQQAFQEQVAAGTYKPEDFDTFWKQYGLPRMQNELLMQGDIEGAKKLMEWGESEAALEGGRLFAGAMFKAQTGDHEGALNDVIKAGKLRGYIAGDFDIDEQEPIVDENGTTIGYRITIRDESGDERVQDIAIDDIPSVIATFANPQAAWESQQAAAADRGKRDAEFEDWKRKEDYKAANGEGGYGREDAIKSLRDRVKADLAVDGSVNFDDLPRDQREKMITEEIAFMNGQGAQPSAPAPRVIMDSNTGQPVPMAQPQAMDGAALSQAPGLGGAPQASVPTSNAAAPSPAASAGAPVRGNAVINGVEDPGLPAVSTPAELVDQAARQMVEGKNPQDIARMLRATNVDPSMWPPGLQRLMETPGGR